MEIERLEYSPETFRLLKAKAISLQSELDDAEGRLADIRDAFLKVDDLWPALALSRMQTTIFGVLMRREFATKPMLYQAVYDLRPYCDRRVDKIIEVQIHTIRHKLRPFDITIKTLWGHGYQITGEMKARVHALTQTEGVA